MRRAVVRSAALAALLSAAALPRAARAQDRSPWLPPPGLAPQPAWQRPEPPPSRPLPSLLLRPLALPAGTVLLQWGAGFAYSSVSTSGFGSRDNIGLGVSFDLTAGLGRHLQLDFGTGLRFATLLAADRYGRVFREEVFQTGNRFIGNPWLKLRWAFLDGVDRAVRVGVEALLQAPLAEASAWSLGVGLPVQFAIPDAHLRIESGLFMQFMLSEGSSTRNVLNVPVRVLFGVSEGFAVGLVTGMQMGNAFRDDASAAHVQLGLLLRGRVGASVELSGQALLPAASPSGLDAYGLGFAVTHRVR